MKKIFVTTFNKALFDKFAYKLIETYINTNQIIPLYCYVEDDINLYPKHENIFYVNLFTNQPECKKFVERNKEKNKNLPKNVYLLDSVRFSYKVFAQSDSRKYGEHIFYIDADTYFIKSIPSDWYDTCLPENIFTSFYDRLGYYTESGFLAFNGSLKTEKGVKLIDLFFALYTSYYTKDLIYSLPAFTDCHAFDAARMRFIFLSPNIQKYKIYKEKKLGDRKLWFSTGKLNVMDTDNFINDYIVHEKGAKKFK